MNRLQSFTRYVKQDPGYVQGHGALSDTIDLFNLLVHVTKTDGNIIDEFSYFANPEWLQVADAYPNK